MSMRVPLVWILRGPKAGDYAQLQLIARAMNVQATTKQLVFRPWELLLHAFPKPTLAALDRSRSDALVAPWPDLVLTAGRRNELVALWIRAASGNHSRIVHVGRPWSHPRRFDLVVSNRQYLLAEGDNVIVNDLPLTDLSESLAPERAVWGAKWASLPRPWTVVLVGGDSGPLVLTSKWARELADRLNARKDRVGGSILLSTSGRTPVRSADVLLQTLKGPRFVYRWPSSEPNPFRGLLACGDEFVVTGDSMSMLAEASATGKSLYIFDFADSGFTSSALRWKPLVHRLAMSIGPRRMRRDVGRIHASLVEGRRVHLLQEMPNDLVKAPPEATSDDLARTVRRVRALLER